MLSIYGYFLSSGRRLVVDDRMIARPIFLTLIAWALVAVAQQVHDASLRDLS